MYNTKASTIERHVWQSIILILVDAMVSIDNYLFLFILESSRKLSDLPWPYGTETYLLFLKYELFVSLELNVNLD